MPDVDSGFGPSRAVLLNQAPQSDEVDTVNETTSVHDMEVGMDVTDNTEAHHHQERPKLWCLNCPCLHHRTPATLAKWGCTVLLFAVVLYLVLVKFANLGGGDAKSLHHSADNRPTVAPVAGGATQEGGSSSSTGNSGGAIAVNVTNADRGCVLVYDSQQQLAPVGTSCDDGDDFTFLDVCDAAGSCRGQPLTCVGESCSGAVGFDTCHSGIAGCVLMPGKRLCWSQRYIDGTPCFRTTYAQGNEFCWRGSCVAEEKYHELQREYEENCEDCPGLPADPAKRACSLYGTGSCSLFGVNCTACCQYTVLPEGTPCVLPTSPYDPPNPTWTGLRCTAAGRCE